MTFDVDTTYFSKARDGEAFIVSEMDTVSSGGTFNVHLKNPSSSRKSLIIVSLSVAATRTYSAMVHDQFTDTPSNGTSADIQNILMDSAGGDDNGSALANMNVSYTNGTSAHAVGVSGGSSGGASIGGKSKHAPIIMEPGREIVVEATNESASEAMQSISILYYEMPV